MAKLRLPSKERAKQPRTRLEMRVACNDFIFGHMNEGEFRKALEFFSLNADRDTLLSVANTLV